MYFRKRKQKKGKRKQKKGKRKQKKRKRKQKKGIDYGLGPSRGGGGGDGGLRGCGVLQRPQ